MHSYKIYIDENFPSQLADGLNHLIKPQNKKEGVEIEMLSIKKTFGQGAQDEDWIPKVGKEKGIVITQDFRIQTQKHQMQLYIENGVGILFVSPPSKSGFNYWDMVKLLINNWESITKIVSKNKTPFAYRCTAKKGFERIEELG